MRLVLQRVTQASVTVQSKVVGAIDQGWLVLIGIQADDDATIVSHLIEKLLNLRAFNDPAGKMNLSLLDIKGDLLLVSQFTLYADCRKGRRPSFTQAASPQIAAKIYEDFVAVAKQSGLKVGTGIFGADMKVNLSNDGPVTIILEHPDRPNP